MKRILTIPILGALIVLSSLAVFSSSAVGPNLVQNGDFSQGAANWAPALPTTLVQPYAGALLATQPVDTPSGFGFNVVQCVDGVSDLHEYTVEADVLVPSGQQRSGTVAIWLGPNDAPGCGGYTESYPGTPGISPSAWTHQAKTVVPPAGTKSMWVVLRGSMAPAGQGEDPTADFAVAFDNVSLTQGNQVQGATIEICKAVLDNGDPYLDEDTFTFSVAVQGQPPFVTDFPVTVIHEGWAGCNTLNLDPYGVQAGPIFVVTENPKPGWTNQAGYPLVSANNGPVHVGTNIAVANLGASSADFTNKRVANEGTVLPPEPKAVVVCAQIEDNGDADTETMNRQYRLQVQGEQSYIGFSLAAEEGQPPACQSIDLNAVGKASATAYRVTQVADPLWTDAAGYPKYHVGNGFVSGTVADFTYPTGSAPAFFVGFTNKEGVAAPPPPTPTPPPPTPTPPPPTPTPPAPTPAPPEPTPAPPEPTPAPPEPTQPPSTPTPTSTPTPPSTQTPTSTPTPPSTQTPASTPTPATSTPPASPTPASTGTPTSQGGGATPASQEQQPPATEEDVAGTSSTPLAPSTGTGGPATAGGTPIAIVLGLLALVASAPITLLAMRRR